jgi:HPt (histidine-containing phosphotransfer) domain-containing protein
MDDLVAAFMPRFKELARTRLARSIAIAEQRDHANTATIAHDLHAVAGEAGLLGLAAIVALVRGGEEHAKRLRSSRSDADADALVASLLELQRAIEAVNVPAQPSRE